MTLWQLPQTLQDGQVMVGVVMPSIDTVMQGHHMAYCVGSRKLVRPHFQGVFVRLGHQGDLGGAIYTQGRGLGCLCN